MKVHIFLPVYIMVQLCITKGMRCQQLLTKTRPLRQGGKYALGQIYSLCVDTLNSNSLWSAIL